MPVASFLDRYRVAPEDWEAAEQWALKSARHLGLHYERQISAITIYSGDEFWVGGEGEEMTINPDIVTLTFNKAGGWGGGEPYLRNIQFDIGSGKEEVPMPYVEWKVGEASGDPPTSLEELLSSAEGHASYLASRSLAAIEARAKEFPEFFELYTGIIQRIFPHVEHHMLHRDTSEFEEARVPTSHIKKELWRTDILARLQELRFPPLEIELVKRHGQDGVTVHWQPEGHVNYQLWFNLYVGEDPKVNVYTDPTLSGSTTGWLSSRLIKNEDALEKLPYTLEQWATEDLRKHKAEEYAGFREKIRELLRHHLPRDFEEVWASIRRQLIGVRHFEVHTDVDFGESIVRRLKETTENYDLKYPLAGPEVDGRTVGDDISNTGSISASLNEYEVLKGVREVAFSLFTQMGKLSFYSVSTEKRTRNLAEQIKESGYIDPLIVVVDNQGPYILEGGHRFDALRMLEAKAFPALVVLDLESVAPAFDESNELEESWRPGYPPPDTGIGMIEFNSLRVGDRVFYHMPENEDKPRIEIEITAKHLAKHGDNTERYEGVQVDTGREVRLRPFDRYSLELPAPVEHHKLHTDTYEEAFLSHLPESFRIKG